MKKYDLWLLISFALFGLSNCVKKDNLSQIILVQEPSFKIGEGKIINLANNEGDNYQIKIKFLGYKEGRCYRENCSICYGGYINCYLNVQINNQKNDSLILNRISCIPAGELQRNNPNMDRKNINGIEIGLSNVTELTKSTDVDDYSIKLSILKQ